MDHSTIILRAEALALEAPYTNIILQNIRPSALNEHYKVANDMRVRQFRNGSSISVSALPA